MENRSEVLNGLVWRSPGPHRGGRVVAVAGHPSETGTFYMGACAGGVWKTTDGGAYWRNISDDYFNTSAIGALAVSDSDPNVLYAGTGETAIRGNVSHGDGVYKSTDGGRTWENVGLSDTRHIGRIRVHPDNADLVYVAALGHAWGSNPERGVYRSLDGGRNWELILHRSDRAGAIDLSMDPSNPRTLFASIWQAQRYPYKLESGGDDSGLWRSTDGGDTWVEITRKPGLPAGVLGKIGVAVSPAKTGRVFALVEAEDGALFRSDDNGENWIRLSEQEGLRWRAWYYMHIYADPGDPDNVWVLNGECWKSIDGGKSFFVVPTPHGDNHDLWIDPKNSQRMIEGNDGGACVSYNGGFTWSSIYNQPTAQFYHVTTDDRVPYRLYGSQQDNSALSVPVKSIQGAITAAEWFVPGGGESGYIAIRPDNPDIMFAGAIGSGEGNGRLTRYDHRTGQIRNITVHPLDKGFAEGADTLRYRFQWTFPIEISPHDPDTLYVTSNFVHRSRDEGMSWETISTDLTRNDPEKLKASGGPITKDNSGAEIYCTIFAFRESPHTAGTFWVGTDDGLVHVSRDDGQSWAEITPEDLPEWSLISILEPSSHAEDTLYLAATRYKSNDWAPYLYKTSDGGTTWQKITSGIPEHEFTRVIREDPQQRGLLFAGTETGIYVSFDDGNHWERLGGNLPVTPVHDLVIKNNELVVATHGRGFWILDDLTPLRELAWERASVERIYLFAPLDTVRMRIYSGFGNKLADDYVNYRSVNAQGYGYVLQKDDDGTTREIPLDAGENPPSGVMIHYLLPGNLEDDLHLTISDTQGNEVRSFSSVEVETKHEDDPKPPRLPRKAGLNRFVWDMRHAPATLVPGDEDTRDYLDGPMALPGRYTVSLKAGQVKRTASFEILKDPRIDATEDDLKDQFNLLIQVRDLLSRTHETILALRGARAQLNGWKERFEKQGDMRSSLVERIQRTNEQLDEIELTLIQPKAGSSLQFPEGLNAKLAKMTAFIDLDDARPTSQARETCQELFEKVEAHLDRYRKLAAEEIGPLNDDIRHADLPLIEAQTSR